MYNTTNIGLCLFVQKLSEQCDFANTLDHMLHDRLVCGIWDVRVQRRLLAERLSKPMTWTKHRRQPRKALNICISNNRLTLFTPSRTLRTRPDNKQQCPAIAAVESTQPRTVSNEYLSKVRARSILLLVSP